MVKTWQADRAVPRKWCQMPQGSRLLPAMLVIGVGSVWICSQVTAKTVEVGPTRHFKVPSAAIAAAAPGDTVEIDPSEYFDCAVVTASRLTIEGSGPGVVLTGKTCQGKAIFITVGSDITIRNITFTHARVPDQNGAGIRMEGKNLTIEKSRFIDNEDGILAGRPRESILWIMDCEFVRNGKCNGDCAHGVYAGHIALLHIEHSRFFETKVGHHVKSRAIRTELISNEITDGENGTSSYLVDIPNGGSLIMRDNVLEKGPNSSNQATAISIGAEGVTQPTAEITIENNKFTNDQPRDTTFVRNLTATEASLIGNTLKGRVTALVGDGRVR